MDTDIPSAAEPVGDFARLIAENGILIIIAAAVVFIGSSYALIWLNDFRRRKSGSWIPKEDLLEAMKAEHPDRLIPAVHDLPKLTEHPVFGQWEDDLRSVNRLVLLGDDGTLDPKKTAAAKDLIRTVIRPTRNVWKGIVDTLYDDLDKFEERLGGEQSFRHFVRSEYAKLMEITNRQLVARGLPVPVIRKFSAWIEISDSIAAAMLERACDHALNRNYFRLSEVLDTQLARALSLRVTLLKIVQESDCSEYDPSNAGQESTLDSFPSSPDLGAALNSPDFRYRPDFR